MDIGFSYTSDRDIHVHVTGATLLDAAGVLDLFPPKVPVMIDLAKRSPGRAYVGQLIPAKTPVKDYPKGVRRVYFVGSGENDSHLSISPDGSRGWFLDPTATDPWNDADSEVLGWDVSDQVGDMLFDGLVISVWDE